MPRFNYLDGKLSDDYRNFRWKPASLSRTLRVDSAPSLRHRNFRSRPCSPLHSVRTNACPCIIILPERPRRSRTAPRILDQRWKKPGDEQYTNIPAVPPGNPNRFYVALPLLTQGPPANFYSPYDLYNNSDIMVANAGFIRCRQLALNYQFGPAVLRTLHVRNAVFLLQSH